MDFTESLAVVGKYLIVDRANTCSILFDHTAIVCHLTVLTVGKIVKTLVLVIVTY